MRPAWNESVGDAGKLLQQRPAAAMVRIAANNDINSYGALLNAFSYSARVALRSSRKRRAIYFAVKSRPCKMEQKLPFDRPSAIKACRREPVRSVCRNAAVKSTLKSTRSTYQRWEIRFLAFWNILGCSQLRIFRGLYPAERERQKERERGGDR